MIFYNKLVRDKIPEMITGTGEKPIIRVLEGAEYLQCLEEKLDEEVSEFHESKSPEELADILEVIYALGEAYGIHPAALNTVFQEKHNARGGFSRRIFLIGKTRK